MKTIHLFIASMLMLALASCTNSDNTLSDETSTFESIKSVYGIENISTTLSAVESILSVSVTEMQAVLEALRQESNQQKKCQVETITTTALDGQNEKNKKGGYGQSIYGHYSRRFCARKLPSSRRA